MPGELAASPRQAYPRHMDSLVSTEWLAQHLDEPDLVVVDVSWHMPASGRKGRAEWLAPFLSLTEDEAWQTLPAPDESEVFARCKLNFSERKNNRELYDLHIDILKLRREDPRFREQSSGGIDGAVLGPASFVLRYFSMNNEDRLLLVNFGESHVLHPASEPLLAPPEGCRWQTLWTSESPRYGGAGSGALTTPERWALPAESTMVLKPAL